MTTTSSAESRPRPTEAPSTSALREGLARGVARALADHPILPTPSAMTLQDGSLQRLLGDLARGAKSEHADVLREISEEQGVPLDEIARRAQFTLACLLLPATGTFYEVLGVVPDASAAEIRAHWTAAIHRYHPDRFGGQNPWLDAQARRLIEAYETLRDPERRRRYDADLARSGPRLHASMITGGAGTRRLRRRLLSWRFATLLLALVVAAFWVRMRLGPGGDPPMPVPVPPSPRLLETWRTRFLTAPPVQTGSGGRLHLDAPRDPGGTSPRPATRTRMPEDESKVTRGASALSVGPADSDRDRQAEELVERESALDSSNDSVPVAPPPAPAAAGTTADPRRTGTDR